MNHKFLGVFLALLFVVSLGAGFPGHVSGKIGCQIQISGVDYPARIDVGQSFDVKTQLSVTCSTSKVELGGRVDLIDQSSNRTLSISGIRIGFIGEPTRTFNFTVMNSAQAPAAAGTWPLAIRVLMFTGGEVYPPLATAVQTFEVLVAQQTSYAGDLAAVAVLLAIGLVALALVLVSRPTRRRR